MTTLFLGGIGTGEIILIVLAILLLFGGKKLPELMRGMRRKKREKRRKTRGEITPNGIP